MDDRAEAIEALYRNRRLQFRDALATMTGDYGTAEDAVQEGFARALAHRSSFRGEGTLEGWVWRILLRTAVEQGRAKTRAASANGSLDPRLVEPERDPALAAALRSLPPRRRLIVFLRYFADLSHAQIAQACGISEGTVSATLAQARSTLAEILLTQGVRNER